MAKIGLSRILVTPLQSERASFSLVSAAPEDPAVWHTHMTGTLRKSEGPVRLDLFDEAGPGPLPADTPCRVICMTGWRSSGLNMDPVFAASGNCTSVDMRRCHKCGCRKGWRLREYVMHPAFLDACLHAYLLVLDGAGSAKSDGGSSYLPVSFGGFRCYQDGIDQAWVHTRLRSVEKDDTQVIDIRDLRPGGAAGGRAGRIGAAPVAARESRAGSRASADDLFYQRRLAAERQSGGQPRDRIAPQAGSSSPMQKVSARRWPAGWKPRAIIATSSTGRMRSPAGRREPGPSTSATPRIFAGCWSNSLATEAQPCEGVVYLWGLDAPPIEGLTYAKLKSASEMMCRGALAILHALAETRSKHSAGRRLWFVTANTQSPEGANTARRSGPGAALGPGPNRSDRVSRPLGRTDRSAAERRPARDIDCWRRSCFTRMAKPRLRCLRRGQRHVPRFIKQSLAELPAQPPPVRADASYLVTGGLGMLGHRVAKWLISKGAKHLVLTGRNASSDAAKELFSPAESNGAGIHVIAADISRDEDVRRLIADDRQGASAAARRGAFGWGAG